MKLRRNEVYLSTRVDDEIVMLNGETGDFVGLTATAAAAWDLLDQPRDMDSLCAALSERFDVSPHQCREEIGTFIDDMIARDAVVVEQAEASR